LKPEPSTAARTLRAVALVVTLISVLTFGGLVYSVYQDVSPFVSRSTSQPAISVLATSSGLSVNVTFRNSGLYPIAIGAACSSSTVVQGVSCTKANATILPGQTQTVEFSITSASSITALSNVTATVQLTLEPLASVSVVFSPSALLEGSGGAT